MHKSLHKKYYKQFSSYTRTQHTLSWVVSLSVVCVCTYVHKLCQRRERKRIVCFPWNLFHDWGEPRSCHSQKIVLIVSITTKLTGNGYGERDDAQHNAYKFFLAITKEEEKDKT